MNNVKPKLAKALGWIEHYYGLKGTIRDLPGDVDNNYYFETAIGDAYTFKVSRAETPIEEWSAQQAMLMHLSQQNLLYDIPMIYPASDGETIAHLGSDQLAQLQSWVPGKLIGDMNPITDTLLVSWGSAMGALSKALKGFDHPALHKVFRWDPSQTLLSRSRLQYFELDEEKAIANYFWDMFETEVVPELPHLRLSCNYSDGHMHNLLTKEAGIDPVVTGIIDFGDAVYSQTINELAIACAYAGMDRIEPVRAIKKVVGGYHAVFPIEEKELKLLFPLITARLMVTVANAAWGKHQEPDNAYLQVSAKPAWTLLKKLRKVHPRLAYYTFRSVCGLEPCPKKLLFDTWIAKLENGFPAIIDFENKKLVPIDLSVGSMDLGNNSHFETTANFNKLITRFLEDKGADIAYGGYAEARPLYTTENYQFLGDRGPQWRTVHLGFDLWSPAGTKVRAPLAGQVYNIGYDNSDKDYGGYIILEHFISSDLVFYTLYGHLSKASVERLKQGDQIREGQVFCEFGTVDENGHWPPHLHFEIVLDLMDSISDFDGVAFPHEKEIYLSLCPDPQLLIPSLQRASKEKKSQAAIHTRRKEILGKSLSVSYEEPLHIVRGYLQYLYDTNGRRYLDTCNNVAHVGHEHPAVIEAIIRQSAVLNTNARYIHENIVQFAEELLETLPPELSVVHFVNSGSEANELALRMAKTYRGREDMIAVEVGYHGSTGAAVGVSSYKFDGRGGNGAPEHTQVVPIPDSYRGLYRGEGTGNYYASHVKQAIKDIEIKNRKPAGFICESILSCGGQIVLPKGYLQQVFSTVRAAGGVCILDEVQVGFGRVGNHYWAFEEQQVIPDILTLGKPIGNGYPLAAVVTTREIADAFANGMEYFSTFVGNPVACAVGSAVMQVIKEEGLQENALVIGNYLLRGLRELQEQYTIIGEVRGRGLFLGFELVRDRQRKTPADTEATYLINRMRELGFLMSLDGPYHNVIKIKPPLCFSEANANQLLYYLEKVLKEDPLAISFDK